jgi:hypothetical protein
MCSVISERFYSSNYNNLSSCCKQTVNSIIYSASSELDSDEDIGGSSIEGRVSVPIVPPPRPIFKVGRETFLAIGDVKRGDAFDEPRKIRGEDVEPLGRPRPKNSRINN